MKLDNLMTSRRSLALSFLTVTMTLLSACSQMGQAPLNSLSNVRAQNASAARDDWFSQLPPNLQSYYADARGKTGQALFDALHTITGRNYHALDYGAARAYLYGTADNFTFNNQTGVVDVYSNLFIPGSGGNGDKYREPNDANKDGTPNDFINAEHTWPQSFFNKNMPMVSDMHHLFPTLSKPNGMRSNHAFGMASEGRVVYTTSSGSKLITRGGRPPAVSFSSVIEEKDNTPFSNSDAVFEPGDSQKGNTARAMMYFYMRYKDANIRNGNFSSDFWAKRVGMFRDWAAKDPVDERERTREELIFEKQGNRNPFTDIPNLASLIGDDVMAK